MDQCPLCGDEISKLVEHLPECPQECPPLRADGSGETQ
jgi:hypothetical protein